MFEGFQIKLYLCFQIKLASAVKSASQDGQTSTVQSLTSVAFSLQPSPSSIKNTSPTSTVNSTVPRRIIVIPVRNKDGSSSPVKRLSPVKATCLVSSQPLSSLANVSNCSSYTTDYGKLSSVVPNKGFQMPIARFIMDSSSSSSSSSSPGPDGEIESNDNSFHKLITMHSQSVLKSVSFGSLGSDDGAISVSVCEDNSLEKYRPLLVNSTASDHHSNSFSACTNSSESNDCELKSSGRTCTSSPSRAVIASLKTGNQAIPKLLLKPKTVCVPTSAITRPMITGSPIWSSIGYAKSPVQKQPIFRCDSSAIDSSVDIASCKSFPVKTLPGNVTYSCVVTSSDGLNKIILIPASVRSSNLKNVFSSPVRSDNAFQSVSNSGITSSPVVCCTVSTANRPTLVSSVPISLEKGLEKVSRGPANTLTNSDVNAHTADSERLRKLSFLKFDSSDEKKVMSSGKLLGPGIPVSGNFPTNTRVFLMRKVEEASSNWTSSFSGEPRSADLVLAGARLSESITTVISDNESSDNDSVLVLDADTLLPTDKTTSVKQSPAKEKVILLNHSKNPVRTVRTRRSLGNSKENGVEELGRGKRQRKSKLASRRFLESADHDGSAITDKVVKPTNRNKLVRKQNKDVFSSLSGKKNERRNSDPPKSQKQLVSQVNRSKSLSLSPKEKGNACIVTEKSPSKHCRRAESQLNNIPAKSLRVSKKLEKDERTFNLQSSRSRSLSHNRSRTRSQSRTPVKHCVERSSHLSPVLPNGVSQMLPSVSLASLSNISMSFKQQYAVNDDKCVSTAERLDSHPLLSDPIALSTAQLSPKMPHLSRANKSMKMDVTNEDGVIESLVVEIVDITSSEGEEDENKSGFSASVTLESSPCVRNAATNLGTLDSSSLEMPVVSTPSLTAHDSAVDMLSNHNQAGDIVSLKRGSIKPRTKVSRDLTGGTKTFKSHGSDEVKQTLSDCTVGQKSLVRQRPSKNKLYENTIARSGSSDSLPSCNVIAVNLASSSSSIPNQSETLCVSTQGEIQNRDYHFRESRWTVTNLTTSSQLSSRESHMAHRSLNGESQKNIGSNFVDSSAKTSVGIQHETSVGLEAAKIILQDIAFAENDECKMTKKRPLLKVQRNRSSRGIARKRKRNMATSSLADDNDYTDQVKRLNRVYGGNQKRSRQFVASSKQSRLETDATGKAYTGPVVRIRGQKENPFSCLVVAGECEADEETTTKPKKKQVHSESSRLPTIFNLDDSVPWLCVFCHRGSNYRSMGDLFGPYYCRTSEPAAAVFNPTSQTSKDRRRVAVNKSPETGQSSKLQHQRKIRVQKYAPATFSTTTDSSKSSNEVQSIEDVPSEIWVHEECAIWTSNVYMLGSQLQGLEDAAIIAIPSV